LPAALRCCRFAAVGPTSRTYQSTAACSSAAEGKPVGNVSAHTGGRTNRKHHAVSLGWLRHKTEYNKGN